MREMAMISVSAAEALSRLLLCGVEKDSEENV
jgi:hypothetical protein